MALAEVADGSEVRRIERDNHHEIVPLAAGSRNAPRALIGLLRGDNFGKLLVRCG